MEKQTIWGNTLLLLGSVLFCLMLFGIGEVLTRQLSNVTFFGNSRNLFAAGSYGVSHGNAKNVQAVSFGTEVFTDRNGFRVPKHRSASQEAPKQKALFILGDSVGFGPGLRESETFAGMLRSRFPDREIYNSSVIGYSTHDYRNVVDSFQFAQERVDQVFLVFCLNDISHASTREIERLINPRTAPRVQRDESNESGSFVDFLKNQPIFRNLNESLRSNSKLYLLLKGELTDPQARYWLADYRSYLAPDQAPFLESMQDIRTIADKLRHQDIAFTVIISPYEYQLRNPDESILIPQNRVRDYLTKHAIDTIDSTPWFIREHAPSKTFFLAYDPMHLSAKGHEIIYKIMVDRIEAPGM